MIKKVLGCEIVRFGVVGLASNLVLYLFYLGITNIGLGYKVAMSFLYVVGVLQTFIFNKNWTFKHKGYLNDTFIRYILIYGAGYFINLGALVIFVDRFGYPHQWVQCVMIPVVAVSLFVMQKIWVFRVQE
jgi:putative flippase GtrA